MEIEKIEETEEDSLHKGPLPASQLVKWDHWWMEMEFKDDKLHDKCYD